MKKIFDFVIIPAVLAFTALVVFSASSPNLSLFSSLSLEEPHPIGPVWQAAATGSFTIQVANVYTAPVMTATSYSGLVDSLYIRVVSLFTGAKPVVSDPEFVDPVLQWFLVFKHGFVCLILFVINYFVLLKVIRSPILVGIFQLLFVTSLVAQLSPEGWTRIALTVFQSSTNSEATFCTYLLFSIFLYYFTNPTKRASGWIGAFAAYSATIRLQVAPFALAPLNSVRSWKVFLVTLLVSVFGLFFSSNELSSVFHAVTMANDGHSQLSLLGHILENVRLILWIYPYFLPVFIYGVYRLFGPPFTQRKCFYGVASLLVLVALLPSQNHQIRYFLGIHSAYLSASAYGFYALYSRLTLKNEYKKWVKTAGVILFIGLNGYLLSKYMTKSIQTWGRVVRYYLNPENDIFIDEKFVLDAVQKHKKVYLDRRLRVNLEKEPFSPYRDRIQLFDLFNDIDRIPQGSTVIAICYPWNEREKFGIGEGSFLQKEFERQCHGHQRDFFTVTRPQNTRLNPLMGAEPLVQFEMPPNSYAKKLEIKKGTKLYFSSDVFDFTGPYVQEWEGGVRNPYLEIPETFMIRHRMNYAVGKVGIKVLMESRYREGKSVLNVYFDNRWVGECQLGTGNQLKLESKIPAVLFPVYSQWRNKYFDVPCQLDFSVMKPGNHDLAFKIHTTELRGGVRVLGVEYSGL